MQWSLRVVRIDFQLQDLARRPLLPPFGEEIHHRSETLVGLTDPWLGLRLSGAPLGLEAAVRLGATLPLGATVENPFRLGRAGEAHQHTQFGTGTVDPFAEALLQRRAGRFIVGGWLLGKASLYANRHGYQAGALLTGGVRASSDLWLPRWQFQLGALCYHEEPERWSGVIETEGNLGRTDLMLETSVLWRFAPAWTVSLGARVPVWSRITGAQLSTPAIADLSFSRLLRLGR